MVRGLTVALNATRPPAHLDFVPLVAVGQDYRQLQTRPLPSMKQVGNVYFIAAISIIGGGLFGASCRHD